MFKECNLAYKSLKSNSQIVISKADKGSQFIILNKDDYNMKMNAFFFKYAYKKYLFEFRI